RLPDLRFGHSQRIAQTEVILSPPWNITIVQLLKRFGYPRRRMHAIGNGVNDISAKEVLRDFSMLFRYTVDIVTQIERQIGHVEPAFTTKYLLHAEHFRTTQHTIDQFQGKLVVSCGHRRMRGEDAVLSDLFDILVGD